MDVANSKRAEVMRHGAGASTGILGFEPTARERLEARKMQLQEALENTEEALKALDDNPGAEQVMNALRKCGI